MPDVDGIIIRANGKVTAAHDAGRASLRVVGRHGVGVEAIDQVAAAEPEDHRVNTPYSNTRSVASTVLDDARPGQRLPEADRAIRSGIGRAATADWPRAAGQDAGLIASARSASAWRAWPTSTGHADRVP